MQKQDTFFFLFHCGPVPNDSWPGTDPRPSGWALQPFVGPAEYTL